MDIKLKDGHVLTAYCRRLSGEATYSELDLDEFLGTKKGMHGSQSSTAIEFHPYVFPRLFACTKYNQFWNH